MKKSRRSWKKSPTPARAFRYPGVDEDGFRAMRIEGVVGWRDGGHYPGDVAYGERSTWDASPLYAAAATLDPDAIGYAQQMFADGQFFISLERQMAQDEQPARHRRTAGRAGPLRTHQSRSRPAPGACR